MSWAHCWGGSAVAWAGDCIAICDMTLPSDEESVRSVGGPAAVDREGDSGDRCSGGARKEHGEIAYFLGRCEPLVWLLGEQNVADDLLARDVVRLRLPLDLRLDERRVDIAGADRVAGDPFLRRLERDDFCQAQDAVLCGNIRCLERRANQSVRRR